MFKKANKSFSIIISLIFMVMVSNAFASEDWKTEIEEKLKEIYTLSETPLIGEGVTPGSVLKVMKGGLLVAPKKDAPILNNIEDGKVVQPGAGMGFAKSFLLGDTRMPKGLNAGELVYVMGIYVYDNELLFQIMSTEPRSIILNGNTVNSYDIAGVVYKFSNSPYDFSEAKRAIDNYFMLEGSDSEPKEISLGQSTEQVKGILGNPEKIFNLGSKTIYSYKDFKVTFVDGKVSDIQ